MINNRWWIVNAQFIASMSAIRGLYLHRAVHSVAAGNCIERSETMLSLLSILALVSVPFLLDVYFHSFSDCEMADSETTDKERAGSTTTPKGTKSC
jgi:hypothetical protein